MRRSGPLTLALLVAAAPAAAQSPTYEQMQTFSYLLSQVRLNYVLPVNTEQLIHASIDGMLRSLDPHSRFVPRVENDRWLAWQAGQLAGTGIVLEDEDGAATVEAVPAESPAARAGIQPGDRVEALNDTVVAGLSAREVQLRLIGNPGSRLRLRLERGPRTAPDTLTLSVGTALLKPRSVSDAQSLAPGIGYVRLEEFQEDAAKEVRDAFGRALGGATPRGLVLDLRGNPGGEIQAAVNVASLFLPKGTLVCRTEGRRDDADHDYVAGGDAPLPPVRVVVLIDRWTASAAEILAGALQDHDRALLIGRRSFGKALVQRLFAVPPNGDAAWLTIGYVHTPSGRLIQRSWSGLSPEQYYALAGRGGAPQDTAAAYRTDSGRTVRGGGGIEPDSELPAPVSAPLWWSAAADSNFDHAVADSVGAVLSGDRATRTAWLDDSTAWRVRMLEPYLDRVRRRFGSAAVDSAQAGKIAELLAARAAEVRWGADFGEAFRLHNDPDVQAALRRLTTDPPR